MKDLLAPVLAAATEAGARILGVATHDFNARKKDDDSPVTAADMAAQNYLTTALARILPGIPLISEESGESDAAMLAIAMQAPRYWLVDPLDGTRDFLAGTGEYTVNVALVDNGVPVLGCIVAPAMGLCFGAVAGEGSFEFSHTGASTRLTAQAATPRATICLVSRFHQRDEETALHALFPDLVARSCGSSLKYCMIARGDADLTVRRSPTKLWDTAAAQAIVECAGGAMIQRSGAALSYRTGSMVNPAFLSHGAGRVFTAAELAILDDHKSTQSTL